MSSHFCATKEYKDALLAMGPTKAVGAPMKLTSAAWAELPLADKKTWQSQAKAAKEQYNFENYGEAPKEPRKRKSSSDSDSGGGAHKTPKAKFVMNDDIDIEIVTAGPWTALKMPSGAVYVIAKQFESEAAMRTAQADKKAARKPHKARKGAPPPGGLPPPPPPSASGASSSDEDEAEQPEPEPEAEPEPARKSKRARK